MSAAKERNELDFAQHLNSNFEDVDIYKHQNKIYFTS